MRGLAGWRGLLRRLGNRALATAGYRLATTDHAFEQFPGLALELLGSRIE